MGWYRYGMLDVDREGKPYPEELQRRFLTSYVWWNPPISHIGLHLAKAKKDRPPAGSRDHVPETIPHCRSPRA